MSRSNRSGNTSRRDFLIKGSMASVGLMMAGSNAFSAPSFFQGKPNSKYAGVQVGAVTYSYRSMPSTIEQLLKHITDSGISAVELMGDEAEAFAGKPDQKDHSKDYDKIVADWRAKVSMEKFAAIKKMYNAAGVDIYAFKPDALDVKNTDAEIEYALKAAKALGARTVTVELPKEPAQTKRLGDLAAKHNMYIGYHAHLQATDDAWDIALAQSPHNTMNLDCGHYIAASEKNTKESLLALIEAKHDRITSMHLKDRKSKANGGKNMPWGEGDTPIKEILALMKSKKYSFPGSIELEYDIPAGSDAVKETNKCLMYAKAALTS